MTARMRALASSLLSTIFGRWVSVIDSEETSALTCAHDTDD